MTASVEAIQFVIALKKISGDLLQIGGAVMFNNFTSVVEAQGTIFNSSDGVSLPFDINRFMSDGFTRDNTVCDCFGIDYWKSMISWEIDYD